MSLKAYTQLISGCILYGFVGIFLKMINNMPNSSIIFYNNLIGLFFITVYIIFTNKLNLLLLKQNKKFLILLGMLHTFTVFTYFLCIKYTTISIAILLLYTSPMYVTIFSPIFLHEKITKYGIIALILSLIGVLLIVDPITLTSKMQFETTKIIGIVAGIISGICSAGVIITIRYLRNDYDPTAQRFWSIVIAIIILSYAAFNTNLSIIVQNIEILVMFGFISTAVASILYIKGIAQLSAQTGSILSLIEPVSVLFLDHFLLKTPLIYTTLIGCIFILISAVIKSAEPKKN